MTSFPTTSYPCASCAPVPISTTSYPNFSAPIYKTPFLGGYPNYGALGLTGAIGGLTTYASAPTYSAPVTNFSTPPFASVSRIRREVYTAPPTQFLTAPPTQFLDAPCVECAPPPLCTTCAPPPPLMLPAPPVVLSAPPAQLPPPPSVVHIKDDSGPKISSLQAEIRRLERLLAGAKETEAALRGEIGELQARLELLAQKELQLQACDAEVQKLREQLLESQRRIVFLEGQRDEAHKHIAFLEDRLKAADAQMAQMAARIRQLEGEVANLRARLESKTELHSRTNIHETYKVKTFEMAAKLAVMDGTDDGMYNGLPIEVEGEGLYKDLVAKGRRPRENVSLTGRPSSQTTMTETYKVQSFEMAEKLSKMDGTDDGKYNGLPIEVAGEGLYTDLVRRGRRSSGGVTSFGAVTGSLTGGQTYKVSNLEMAAKISKMGGADDGTYKGLPIEVQGLGLYRDIRGRL
eukprot:GGOE01061904.1.p1 GENE.GGOE01061904.1~~GGOE01061904.1.p1  ORF type:complete len:462 (-),score=44.93 GGOE01061904.1:179-1564(-)